MRLDDFTAKIASMLGVPCPELRFVATLSTPTQIAAMDSENLILTLRSSASDLDAAFAVAHELRHLWQQQTERFDLDEHAVPGSVSTIDYNLQAEEIDANAFGALVMESFFHVRPTFPSLPPNLVRLIDARKHTILKEEFQ